MLEEEKPFTIAHFFLDVTHKLDRRLLNSQITAGGNGLGDEN
jgi:hypothetical protein